MLAAGLGLFVGPVLSAFDSPAVDEVGGRARRLWGLPMIALLLTFVHGGRLVGRAEHVLVGAMVVQTAVQVAEQLFLERDGNFLLIHANAGVADALGSLFGLITAAVCLGTAGVIGARFTRASPPRRRALLPSVAGISALLLVGALATVVDAADRRLARPRLAAAGAGGVPREPAALAAGTRRSQPAFWVSCGRSAAASCRRGWRAPSAIRAWSSPTAGRVRSSITPATASPSAAAGRSRGSTRRR